MNNYVAKVVLSVPNGERIQQLKEIFLVEAESVTDAEVKIHKYYENETNAWELTSVTKSNISRVLS